VRSLICIVFFVVVVSASNANEIVGWKAPLTNFRGDGTDGIGVVRLNEPPEKSPFFGEEDAIWDIRNALPIAEKIEWAVWNGTTERIVVKGTWKAIRELEASISTVKQQRITVDTYRIGDNGLPPDFSKRPDASVNLIKRSAQDGTASWQAKGSSIRILVEDSDVSEKGLIDLKMEISTSLPEAADLKIKTSGTFRDGQIMWVARGFEGKSGTDICVTATTVLPDGTPYDEMLLVQDGDRMVRFLADRSPISTVPIKDAGWLRSASLDPYTAHEFAFGETHEDSDPFVDESEKKELSLLDERTASRIPPGLITHLGRGELLDFSEALRKMGITIGEGEFAAYNPRAQRAYFYSKNAFELDKFHSLLTVAGYSSPQNLVITTKGNGQIRLLARSGQKSSWESTNVGAKVTRSLEIDPSIGGGDMIVDLRFEYEEKNVDVTVNSLKTSATLQSGKYVEILGAKLLDGSSSGMEIMAEAFRLPD
jgi:hypothetical protein